MVFSYQLRQTRAPVLSGRARIETPCRICGQISKTGAPVLSGRARIETLLTHGDLDQDDERPFYLDGRGLKLQLPLSQSPHFPSARSIWSGEDWNMADTPKIEGVQRAPVLSGRARIETNGIFVSTPADTERPFYLDGRGLKPPYSNSKWDQTPERPFYLDGRGLKHP